MTRTLARKLLAPLAAVLLAASPALATTVEQFVDADNIKVQGTAQACQVIKLNNAIQVVISDLRGFINVTDAGNSKNISGNIELITLTIKAPLKRGEEVTCKKVCVCNEDPSKTVEVDWDKPCPDGYTEKGYRVQVNGRGNAVVTY